jgi:protein-disulfide isomerase
MAAVEIAAALLLSTQAGWAAADGHATPTVAESAASALARVGERGRVLGWQSAPVTLVVFSDLQCPACDPFFLQALPALLPRWVTTGKVRLEYRFLQTATRNRRELIEEASAADAAGAQNLEWPYVARFFEAQQPEGTEYVNASFLEQIAAETPKLDLAAWRAQRADPRYRREIIGDERLAARRNIVGTPDFLLGHTGKTLHRFEPPSYSAAPFARAFRAILRAR